VAWVLLVLTALLVSGLAFAATPTGSGPLSVGSGTLGAPAPSGAIARVGPSVASVRSVADVGPPAAGSVLPGNGSRPLFGATNSSPVAETGTVVATASTGSGPYGAAYDTANHRMYVVNRDSNNITILNGTAVNATIGLLSYSFPAGIAYDPVDETVYVAEFGTSLVAVIHNQTIVANVTVGPEPIGVAYDAQDGFVYVADSGSGEVTVINGTTAMGSVDVGRAPGGITYDPVDGYIDVANSYDNTTSVISGTILIHAIRTGWTPEGLVFDPTNDLLYVTNSGNDTVTVYVGWTKIATLHVGSVPWGMGYDPANGFVYVADSNANTITILNGTHVVGNIGVGGAPYAVAYDPDSGSMYAVDEGSDGISVISTLLWVGPTEVRPVGNPVHSTDVNENTTFITPIYGLGAGGDNITVTIGPGPGMGCPSYVNLTDINGSGEAIVPCRPASSGLYNVSVIVTDQLGKSVDSWLPFTVYQAPSASVITAILIGSVAPTTSSDVGQAVTFSEHVTGGAGTSQPYNWTGLTKANCSALTTAQPTCTFPLPAAFFVQVSYNDTNGRKATSPALQFIVYSRVVATVPTYSPASADVGQAVAFSEVASGGPGTYSSFVWSGLPSTGCTGISTAHPVCTLAQAGEIDARVAVTDRNGVSDTSPAARFTADTLPFATLPTSSRSSLDAGQRADFATTVGGGSGGYSYAWEGLPPGGCVNATTATPSCILSTPGPVGVWLSVTDSNGGVSGPSGVLTVTVLPHPVLGTPTVTPSSIAPGASVTIGVSVSGGSGGNRFNWSGLPAGCASATATVSCAPSGLGSYVIYVSVTDSNGYTTTSMSATLTIANILPTLFGATPAEFYGSIAGIAVVAIVAAVLLIRRRRRLAAPPPPVLPPVPGYQADDPRIERARRERRP
jgi:YVTN family beta-propeller protein